MTQQAKTVLVVGLIALASLGAAQSRQELPYQPFLTLREQSAALLNYRAVLANLELTDDERAKVAAAYASYQASQSKVATNQTPNETDIENVDREFARSALGALGPAHQDRLYQVLLQVKGPECLQEASVADQLTLTAAQRTRIHRIFEAVQKREEDFDAEMAQSIVAVPHVKPESAYESRKRAAVKALDPKKKMLAKQRIKDEAAAISQLTPAQQKEWKGLLGSPFPLTIYRH